jgi:hypothetical protein
MAEKLRYWLKGMPQAQRDLITILALSVPVYVFLVWINAFDPFFKYGCSHEDYQRDELVALVLFIALRTTAEGIETKDVLDKLVALGCDTG